MEKEDPQRAAKCKPHPTETARNPLARPAGYR